MDQDPVIIIGAGMGGLAAAIDLARAGLPVTVIEKEPRPGGKMRQVHPAGSSGGQATPGAQLGVDAGPTVFTMKWVFDGLFEEAGSRLEDHLTLLPARILARHAWTEEAGGGQLDLHADMDDSVDAIAQFAGPREAAGYRTFCERSRDVYQTLKGSFIADQRPSPMDLVRRVGFDRLDALWRTAPFDTLWSALASHFEDQRLRQLFARYATYCGSSPLKAPATLMLVAHVEQDGVWRVQGGMAAVAQALRRLGESLGVDYRFGEGVDEILSEGGRVSGVRLQGGDSLKARQIVYNGDVGALTSGLLGQAVRESAEAPKRLQRSLSALTWCLKAETSGFPLLHHSVFFGPHYPQEFDAIFRRRTIVSTPTVYICAQDRGEPEDEAPKGRERLLVLINAPADGDFADADGAEPDPILRSCGASRAEALLAECGLTIEGGLEAGVRTGPAGFNALFPGSGGALYGRANHGSMASFARSGAGSRVPGLYLAGGSVHPGPGVPMAAMSGRLAAAKLLEDLETDARNRVPAAPLKPSEIA